MQLATSCSRVFTCLGLAELIAYLIVKYKKVRPHKLQRSPEGRPPSQSCAALSAHTCREALSAPRPEYDHAGQCLLPGTSYSNMQRQRGRPLPCLPAVCLRALHRPPGTCHQKEKDLVGASTCCLCCTCLPWWALNSMTFCCCRTARRRNASYSAYAICIAQVNHAAMP